MKVFAGVHQHEAARAIGVFGHARAKAGLAKQRALLVARHAANGQRVAQQRRQHLAKVRGRRQHARHHVWGDVQRLHQFGVPGVAVHVKQHGARGVAHVGGVHRPARELPHQPAVHRAKGQLAVGRLRAGARHVVQDPLQLGARKIGIHQQAGFLPDGGRHAALAQGHAARFGAPVLPDDGVVDGLPRGAVPHHGGFALVGNAYRTHLLRADAGFEQHLAGGGQLGAPDFQRVVFYPAGVRVDLGNLLLGHGNDGAVGVKHDAAGAGGALVKSEQVGHGSIQYKKKKGGLALRPVQIEPGPGP